MEDLQPSSLKASHPRSREWFQAMYIIDHGQKNASQWTKQIQWRQQTVWDWVPLNTNEWRPTRLHYQPGWVRPARLMKAKKDRWHRKARCFPGSSATEFWPAVENCEVRWQKNCNIGSIVPPEQPAQTSGFEPEQEPESFSPSQDDSRRRVYRPCSGLVWETVSG